MKFHKSSNREGLLDLRPSESSHACMETIGLIFLVSLLCVFEFGGGGG